MRLEEWAQPDIIAPHPATSSHNATHDPAIPGASEGHDELSRQVSIPQPIQFCRGRSIQQPPASCASMDPGFETSMLSLVNMGFIYAIAHIRGGGEMGRKWYEEGKLLKKRNTFTDFISSAEYLIENKYCSKEKLCIIGGSAGGLFIGAVLNMRPDLFKAAVAEVPFVDAVTALLDPTLPLTTTEWEEFGDPRKEEYYYYLKSYSPVDNVRAQDYPNMLVTASLFDNRVLYFEPAKFVAKLRATKTDDNILLFKCDFNSGHSSKSGRFEKLGEDAFTCAFIMNALDLAPLSSLEDHSSFLVPIHMAQTRYRRTLGCF